MTELTTTQTNLKEKIINKIYDGGNEELNTLSAILITLQEILTELKK